MDTETLLPLLEQLDDHVDNLEEVLQPFLGHSLSKSSKNLPLMDKAKLHVLITYTLESLMFSYLRLHGTDAKQHPVFRELTRVRQYFEKIKVLETEPEQRPMTLDKEAAGRFIKHGLAGNDKLDLERAEQQARERARAEIRAAMLAKKSAAASQGHPTPAQNVSSAGVSDDDADSDEEVSRDSKSYSQDDSAQPQKPEKKEKNKAKEEKTKARSKDAKAAKKQRKHDKSGRKEEKKERRQKKEEARKARKAN